MSLISLHKIVLVIKSSLMLGTVPPVKLVPELSKKFSISCSRPFG
jgi:hypothetical protein